jgi:hypothetical protein
MRYPTILALLLALLVSTTTAAAINTKPHHQRRTKDKLQFPLFTTLTNHTSTTTFNSPSIEDCGSLTDVFQPTDISISPDPPKRGQPLTVTVTGELSQDVTDGAFADVKVKLGVIKLVEQRLDLCKEITQIERECPVEKGRVDIKHTVDIPREVPPVSTRIWENFVIWFIFYTTHHHHHHHHHYHYHLRD